MDGFRIPRQCPTTTGPHIAVSNQPGRTHRATIHQLPTPTPPDWDPDATDGARSGTIGSGSSFGVARRTGAIPASMLGMRTWVLAGRFARPRPAVYDVMFAQDARDGTRRPGIDGINAAVRCSGQTQLDSRQSFGRGHRFFGGAEDGRGRGHGPESWLRWAPRQELTGRFHARSSSSLQNPGLPMSAPRAVPARTTRKGQSRARARPGWPCPPWCEAGYSFLAVRPVVGLPGPGLPASKALHRVRGAASSSPGEGLPVSVDVGLRKVGFIVGRGLPQGRSCDASLPG